MTDTRSRQSRLVAVAVLFRKGAVGAASGVNHREEQEVEMIQPG